MHTSFAHNSVIAILIASIGMAGCVTTNTNNPQQEQPSNSQSLFDSGCNSGIAALAGAVAGGLLAKGTNRVKGAALGAGIASLACAAWNYHAKQTKTAEQVQSDYKRANAGQLPTQSRVTAFNTKFDPSAKIAPGGKMTVTSNIEVVQGTDGHKPVIEEEMTLVKPDASEIKARKRANETAGGGAFATSFSMTMPEGVPQGDYPVKTALFMDGKQVGNNNLKLQIVALPSGELVASLH